MYSRNILLVGLWYPSNDMLRHFSSIKSVNPDGWKGKNWKNLGFNVRAYFPEFSEANKRANNPGPGTGDFQVDYDNVYNDLQLRIKQLKPVAIITFTRNIPGGTAWELEAGARDREVWGADSRAPLNPDTGPVIRRQTRGIPLVIRKAWNAVKRRFGFTYSRNRVYHSNLPLEEIRRAFDADDNLPPAYIDTTNDTGGFISEYLGILAMEHRRSKNIDDPDFPCLMAGPIHVPTNTDLPKAQKAAEKIVELSINSLKTMYNPATWIGWMGFRIKTADTPHAGTMNKVTVDFFRNGNKLYHLNLDENNFVDMQRGSDHFYAFKLSVLKHDRSTPLPPDVGRTPSPFPEYGVEFSDGLDDHTTLRFEIDGNDAWTAEDIEIFVKEWRFGDHNGTFGWHLHPDWIQLPNVYHGLTLSTDSSEGKRTHTYEI